ncbi:MAG: thiosulfate/3-mercaptopyruvate sulfurtransferase [Candidatus Azotimanducaceae bacterium]|jgi:thiosulfate/3-mercaptopyruvate sulfurtransferase
MKRNDLLIEAEELASKLGNSDLRLFDATFVMVPGSTETGASLYKQGHIPGAVFLDHANISDTSSELNFTLPAERDLAAKLGTIGIGNGSEVVVYAAAQGMMWATRLWWVLRYAGHENVRVLNGGLGAWQGELETTENQYDPASFKLSANPAMFADTEEVAEAIGNGAVCTLNALPPSFYTGEAEVEYAQDGHITGSLSLPFLDMTDGQFIKSDDALRETFASYADNERIINYCGGGIAATLTASCAMLAGLTNVAVYDGSLSEWRQEALPVTKGNEPGTL